MVRGVFTISLSDGEQDFFTSLPPRKRSEWVAGRIREAMELTEEKLVRKIASLRIELAGAESQLAQFKAKKAKAVIVHEETEREQLLGHIQMAAAFVKEHNPEAAKRYLMPLVKAGKITAEHADSILRGEKND